MELSETICEENALSEKGFEKNLYRLVEGESIITIRSLFPLPTIFFCSILIAGMVLCGRAEAEEKCDCTQDQIWQGPLRNLGPFDAITASYRGGRISRLNHYDLQPAVLYDTETQPPMMWMYWLGQFQSGNKDLPPGDLLTGDRIYAATSTNNGETWSSPQVVLKGRGGTNGLDNADDHLVGSPSVLKINGKFFMFYEAYSNWATVINRFYSGVRTDTWISHGTPEDSKSLDFSGTNMAPDFVASYADIRETIGYAPRHKKAGTKPIYGWEVRYSQGNLNRFVSCCNSLPPIPQSEDQRILNGGEPLFYLYNNPGPGRHPLYSCFNAEQSNSFLSMRPDCGDTLGSGQAPDACGACSGSYIIGYAATNLDSPDMIGSLQNRICLATSSDGKTWTRHTGPFRGGAVIVPKNQLSNRFPHDCPKLRYDINRKYGSGFPIALVRDDMIEIYYTDDSELGGCDGSTAMWRIRVPVRDIENNAAYLAQGNSGRQYCGFYVGDLKWSPMTRRYYALGLRKEGERVVGDACFRHTPIIQWTSENPSAESPPVFPFEFPAFGTPEFLPVAPGNAVTGRWGIWGTIAGTGLGHTLDFPSASPPYIAFHCFYEATASCNGNLEEALFRFQNDIDHLLVFGFSPENTPTPTRTRTPSVTPTRTVSLTPTKLPTSTFTPTLQSLATETPHPTTSPSQTALPTITYTPTADLASTVTPTSTSGSAHASPTQTRPAIARVLKVEPEVRFPIDHGPRVFVVHFSTPMNPSINPIVTFGASPPYQDSIIAASQGWVDAVTWNGWADISEEIEDDTYTLRIEGAVAEDGFQLPVDNSHAFRVQSSNSDLLGEGRVVNSYINALGLEWDASPNELNGELLGYFVLRAPGVEGPFSIVGFTSPGEISYIDAGLLADTMYVYRVYELILNQDDSDIRFWTQPFGGKTLTRIANGRATPLSQSRIQLEWEVADPQAVSAYKVLRSLTPNEPSDLIAEVNGDVQQFIDSGLRPDTKYIYDIILVDHQLNQQMLENPLVGNTLGLDVDGDGRVDANDLLQLLESVKRKENSNQVFLDLSLDWLTSVPR